MNYDVQRRTQVLETIMLLHHDLLEDCERRWAEWRPTDYMAELRRIRAEHNPDSSTRLRLSTLDDPTFFFWSIQNTYHEVFPELARHREVSVRRLIGIRNSAAHGESIEDESINFLAECASKLRQILVMQPSVNTKSPQLPSPSLNADLVSDVSLLSVYVVCDRSASMAGAPIEAVNSSLREMQKVFVSDPIVSDKSRFSLLSFSSTAQVEIDLQQPDQIGSLPQIEAEGITNYGSAFRLLRNQIDQDFRELTKQFRTLRPVIYFLTDGEPSDEDWFESLEELVDVSNDYAPTLVVLPVCDLSDSFLSELVKVRNGVVPQVHKRISSQSLELSIRNAIKDVTASIVATALGSDDQLILSGR